MEFKMRRIDLMTIIVLATLIYGCAGNDVGDNSLGQNQRQDPGQGQDQNPGQVPTTNINNYPLHTDITVTFFWIGENGSAANSYIPNGQSAWDDKWADHFGGIDDPLNRTGYNPTGFAPNENPFYFALPYNDFDQHGLRKKSAADVIYWSGEKQWGPRESMCKNRWIQIIKADKIAYAQWEDVGPYNEDDSAYVFGDIAPLNTINNNAGLDVSPAVRDYLGLSGIDTVDWKFIDADKVPNGPWKDVLTNSQITWK